MVDILSTEEKEKKREKKERCWQIAKPLKLYVHLQL